ncbi:MAG TPA: aldose 1-epimerase family protein [Puia sp.]|nr:aldose 1-epimerase family protein [Puia sp.]
MFFIENQQLAVKIHPKGAELQSIFHKGHRVEYMWSGDPAFWGKHSPLLFPIVGTLKENTYYYRDRTYQLSRHGFARDMEFSAERQHRDSISFLLQSNATTRANFPFEFELRIVYRLTPDGLTITYQVKNPAPEEMFFSIGGHPAFAVPIVPGTTYTDYYLEFGQAETVPRWPISKDGLIETSPIPLLDHTKILPLTKELFAKDALVLKQPLSSSIALRSSKTERGLRMDFPGFSFLGIWAAPKADFVCIEPWCGIADSTDSRQQWTQKEGINRLGPGDLFERTWALTVF